jgi:hypothetical protein
VGHDVAARLTQGRAAVDDFAAYVWACRLRGYHHPDLTGHAAAVHDLYGSQDGLDLAALDADCATLQTAAATAAEGASSVRGHLGAVTAAWAGPGVQSCADFLRRHCEAAEFVAGVWQQAARGSSALRDELWRIVEEKVAATLSAARGAQPDWPAVAQAVLTGTADETGLAVLDQQVRPFVETVLAGRWVADMHAATAAVRAAYRAALEGVGTERVRFEIPGDLGPRAAGVRTPGVSPPTQNSMGTWPSPTAALPIPETVAPTVPGPETVPPVVPPTPVASAEPVAPTMSSPPALPEPGVPDPPKLADPVLPEPGADEPNRNVPDADEATSEEPEEDPESEEEEKDAVADEEPEGPEEQPEPEPEPELEAPRVITEEPAPPEPAPAPPPDCAEVPPPDPSTPCEMAADELPQVGR